jgi:hypothetical protein
LSFGWLDDAPPSEDFVGSYGRIFDVIVMSRPDANETFVHNRALYSGLFESGRPILLAPPVPPPQIATNVSHGTAIADQVSSAGCPPTRHSSPGPWPAFFIFKSKWKFELQFPVLLKMRQRDR